MMHDHALHEINFRLRPWRQLSRCGGWQPLARLSGRTRLDHYRAPCTSLLCLCGRTQENCRNTRCNKKAEAIHYCKCSCSPIALAGTTIRQPVQNIARHLGLGGQQSLSRNINIFRDSARQTAHRQGSAWPMRPDLRMVAQPHDGWLMFQHQFSTAGKLLIPITRRGV